MAVKNGDVPSSPFKYILLLTGDPITDPLEIQDLAELPNQEVHRIPRESADKAGWMETGKGDGRRDYEAHLTEREANNLHITAIAFLYADETFWGYAPYRPEKNGLSKDESFGWTFKFVVVETNASELTVQYMPCDFSTISDRLFKSVIERLAASGCLPETCSHGCLDFEIAAIHEKAQDSCSDIHLAAIHDNSTCETQ